MSTGGNVPTQGVVISEATTQKKRGERGKLGNGTPGSRLKAKWRKERKKGESLKHFVREFVASPDAATWLESKR